MDLFRRIFKRGEPATKKNEALPQSEIVTQPLDPTYLTKTKGTEEPVAQDTAPPAKQEPLKTRPLPPPKPFSSTHRRIKFGQASDMGQVRNNNQDACLSIMATAELMGNPPPIGFFVVADGMGGHRDGELASATAVQTLAKHILEEIVLPHVDGRERTADQKTIPEVLAEAMQAANEAVQAQISDGGTTATCAVVRGDLTYIAHVGDSRAYLITDDKLELITRDHSLVRRLQELGQLTSEEAEVHPQRNVLYRALGQSESLEVDAATRRLPPSSKLLLCSDGLWGVVGDEKMMEILKENEKPQEACDKLVALANTLGGPDNITVVLMQMPE
jgi:serine/threonine protein phosphatase PrpC